MKEYEVTFPIGGHVTVYVEAVDETEAIEKAGDDCTEGDIYWEILDKVNSGNVCFFPQPWETEVRCIE